MNISLVSIPLGGRCMRINLIIGDIESRIGQSTAQASRRRSLSRRSMLSLATPSGRTSQSGSLITQYQPRYASASKARPSSLSDYLRQSTPDWWAHQYLQQTNQIWVKDHTDGMAWTTDGSYSNVMGMEPNYPCCMLCVNMHDVSRD